MDLEELRDYCLSLPATFEDTPFGPDTLVFKVSGKIFALTGLEAVNLSVNLKCEPEKAIELRERYFEIIPGFHMNKSHWNTVSCTGNLNNQFIKELIQDSYELVVKSMTKKQRESL